MRLLCGPVDGRQQLDTSKESDPFVLECRNWLLEMAGLGARWLAWRVWNPAIRQAVGIPNIGAAMFHGSESEMPKPHTAAKFLKQRKIPMRSAWKIRRLGSFRRKPFVSPELLPSAMSRSWGDRWPRAKIL